MMSALVRRMNAVLFGNSGAHSAVEMALLDLAGRAAQEPLIELVGGILVALGLFTRIPAAMLAVVMVVAIKSAKWGDVDSLETLLGFEEATYFAAFLWLAIAGPGAASLDRLLVNAAGHPKEST